MENIKYNDFLKEYMYINKLPNGVMCYIIPKKDYVEKQAMVTVNYGAAQSKFEIDGKTYDVPDGIAHFLEHKLFEQKTGNVFDEFTKLGGNVNAFTNYTNTAYYFNSMENFNENFKLLLNLVQDLYLTDENVEKEKGIIEQEINMYKDSAFWRTYLNMQSSMYFESPVRKDIVGTVTSIKKITKEDLQLCYDAFYMPSNMAIVCVGDFKPEGILEIASKNIKEKKPKKVTCIYGNEREKVKKNYIEEKMSLSTPMFNLGFKDNDFKTDIPTKLVGTKILLDILCGESSPVYEKLFNKGLIDPSFSVDYSCGTFFGSSVFSGFSKDPKAVSEIIIEEIAQIKKHGIEDEYFERIKKKHIGLFVRSFNSINIIGVTQVDFFSKNMDLFDIMQAYRNLDKDFILKRLNEHFREDNYVLSVVLPKNNKKE